MTKIKAIIQSRPIFFLLLPLFFVLHGFTENYKAVPVGGAVLLWLVYCAAALAIFFLGWIVYRNWLKAAILSFCVMAFHFFFGAIHDFLKINFEDSFIARYSFLLPFFFILFVILIIALRKFRTTNSRIILYLNSLLLIVLFVDCTWLVTKVFSHATLTSSSNDNFNCDSCTKPDIYFLVFDEYSSSSALKEHWNYDNSQLDSFLLRRKFKLFPESRSNYNFTQFSIASTLNMDYLKIPDPKACTVKDYNHCAELIKNNSVCNLLQSFGYKIVNYSVFDLHQNPSPVTETFLPLNTKLITSQTFLSRMKRDLYHILLVGKFEIKWLSKDIIYTADRSNQKTISSTLEIAQDTSSTPKFVYSHIEMPHPPFYFNGLNRVDNREILLEQGRHPDSKSYLNYIPKTNEVLKEIVNKILDNAKRPVAIILVGDHGFRTEQPEQYYFRNLNAVYLSSGNYGGFYDTITNVNEFKVLFNNLFNASLPIKKDSSVFLQDAN